MPLDPITLMTIAALLLGTMAALMLRAARRGSPGDALRDCGFGFGAGAIGLAMILAAPESVTAPLGAFGHAALIFGFGLVWAAARRHARGVAPRPFASAAGALAWLAWIILAEPALAWRAGVSSGILAAYGFAAAAELLRGRLDVADAQRRGGLVLAAHGIFFSLRAVFGPTLGFAALGPNLSTGSGGVFGFELMLFAAAFGTAAMRMSRDRAAAAPRPDALEDPLTGIGNRRALVTSGTPLVADAVAAGRDAALLVMGLDGLAAVNERYGHAAGDALLVAFARLAHAYLPPTSLVCRLGGDEFAAVLPGADGDRARTVADELRGLFAHLALETEGGPIAARVSIGIAQARRGRRGVAELLDAADRCLRAVKRAGRDRVLHESEVEGVRPAA